MQMKLVLCGRDYDTKTAYSTLFRSLYPTVSRRCLDLVKRQRDETTSVRVYRQILKIPRNRLDRPEIMFNVKQRISFKANLKAAEAQGEDESHDLQM